MGALGDDVNKVQGLIHRRMGLPANSLRHDLRRNSTPLRLLRHRFPRHVPVALRAGALPAASQKFFSTIGEGLA